MAAQVTDNGSQVTDSERQVADNGRRATFNDSAGDIYWQTGNKL